MTGTCEHCGDILTKVLPYCDTECLKCHIDRAEATWKKTGCLDIGLLGTAALVGGERWARVLCELRTLNEAIEAFEREVWTSEFEKRVSLPLPNYQGHSDCLEVTLAPPRDRDPVTVLDLSSEDKQLGLIRGVVTSSFKVYHIHASVREACLLLEAAKEFDFSTLEPWPISPDAPEVTA